MSVILGIVIMMDFIIAFVSFMQNEIGRAIIFTIVGGVLFYLKSRVEAGVYKSNCLKADLPSNLNGESFGTYVKDLGIVSGETDEKFVRKHYHVVALYDGQEIESRFVMLYSKPIQCLLFNDSFFGYVDLLFDTNDVTTVSIHGAQVGVGLTHNRSCYMIFDSEEYAKEVYDLLLKINLKEVKKYVQ